MKNPTALRFFLFFFFIAFVLLFSQTTNVYAQTTNCSLNIYPQPTPGTHHYTVTLTNNTSTPGYSFITNYWVDGQPSGNPSNVSTSNYNYWSLYTGLGYSVSGTAGIPIANSSITYETDLTFSSSFEGVDIALLSQSNSSFDICSQDHESYSVTYNNPTTILSVPYFSQNSLPWGPTEYDNSSGKISNPTMDRWGCAVTSAAMVLNYHNIKKMPDGTDLDPGSLNVWLKNNKGYLTGYNNIDGFYSYFNWPVIGKLTKQLFDAGRANVKLMHKRAYPSNNTTIILNEDLKKFPDILGVNNSQTLSHFVVAKGKSNNTYSINDPEWNYPTLN